MSRKVHPIGFRLGVSQTWQLPQPLFSYHQQLLEQLTIYLWLQNFTAQNAFYCLHYTYSRTTTWYSQLNLVLFVPLRKKVKRLKVRLFRLANNDYSLRRRRKGLPTSVKTTNFLKRFRSYLLLAKKLHGFGFLGIGYYLKRYEKFGLLPRSLWNSYVWTLRARPKRKKKYKLRTRCTLRYRKVVNSVSKIKQDLPTTILSKVPANATTGLRKIKRRRLRLASKNYLLFLASRLYLLRLKFFIENQLKKYINSLFFIRLFNINDVFLAGSFGRQLLTKYTYLRILNASKLLVNRLSDYSKYTFLITYTNLLVATTLLRVPHVLLQWLWLYSYRIKKHSLYLTHNQLFSLFEKSIENIILLVGLIKGAKLEVTGKLFDSTRTRKQISYFGHQYKRQTLMTSFVYTFKQIPTYIGVLGFRLWFIY